MSARAANGWSGLKKVKQITGQKPVRTIAKQTHRRSASGRAHPSGARSPASRNAEKFVETALDIVDRHLAPFQFDQTGNVSFGIEEHTDFPGMAYDPAIGIYGMDVNVVLERRGVRIARRAVGRRKLPADQRVKREEAIAFMRERYRVEV